MFSGYSEWLNCSMDRERFNSSVDSNNNENKSCIALYPVNIYELAALYIINLNIYLTVKKANAYININMSIKKI